MSGRFGWRACLATGVILAGCTTTSTTTSTVTGATPIVPTAQDAGAARGRVTASDQTDAERRAKVRLELANAYFERGQLDTALDEVKLSLQASPNNTDALNLRGLVYAALDEPRLAEDSFKRSLQVNPNDGGSINIYAWFLCQRDRLAEADTLFQQALALPQYRDVKRSLHARGICLSRAGRWLEAEGALLRAYELEPANVGIAFNLSDVLYRRQDYERARFYINRVNSAEGAANAQTLWLAARIARKLGDESQLNILGEQLRGRFPQSPQSLALERRQFDE